MLMESDNGQQSGASRASLRDLGLSATCLSAEHAAVFLGLPVEHARRIKQLGESGEAATRGSWKELRVPGGWVEEVCDGEYVGEVN